LFSPLCRLSLAVIILLAPDESIAGARLVLGAVAPRPVRALAAEALLRGKRTGPALLEETVASVAETVKTVLGNRASAPYKRIAVRSVAKEALQRALSWGL